MQVKFEFKIKILGQNWVYDEDRRLLTLKTKNSTTMFFPEDLENTPFNMNPKKSKNKNNIQVVCICRSKIAFHGRSVLVFYRGPFRANHAI